MPLVMQHTQRMATALGQGWTNDSGSGRVGGGSGAHGGKFR